MKSTMVFLDHASTCSDGDLDAELDGLVFGASNLLTSLDLDTSLLIRPLLVALAMDSGLVNNMQLDCVYFYLEL